MRQLILSVVIALAALPAAANGASPLCDDDVARGHDGAREADDGEELILPCAMLDSGQLGPWCADATVYVVSIKGTLLCRVLLPSLDLVQGGGEELSSSGRPVASPDLPGLAPPFVPTGAALDLDAPLVSLRRPSWFAERGGPGALFFDVPLVPG